MKAYVLDQYRKNAALRLTDLPMPELGLDDVLIEVHAAGLNQLDSKIRDGEFKPLLRYRPPFVLGHDVAGVVLGTGANVRRFRAGDEVYARPRDGRIGTFAEFITVDEADVARKPANIDMAGAASVPLIGLTAWQVFVERGKLKPGQKVLIHAGSGGVGTFAIQLAKHLGAEVATTAGTSNLEFVRGLGADIVVDYRTEDFEKLLSGYDLVLCGLDAGTLRKSLTVLKPGGKLISISGPPDPAFAREKRLNWVLRQAIGLLSIGIRRAAKARQIGYSFLFMQANGDQLGQITKLIDEGQIRPVIDRQFPFAEMNAALAYLDTGRAKGKVVVTLK